MVDILALESAWPEQRVCVVSPHPDDDILACGGTLGLAWAAGAALRVVYVTDGSASHTGSRTYPPQRLCDVREDEARSALAVLGVPATQARFLREPDGRLASDGPAAAALADRLAGEFRTFAPTLVFSPWIRDGHSDHAAVSIAVRRALTRAGSTAALYEYAVWLEDLGSADDAPRPNEARTYAVDVRAFRERKARALREHRSQFGGLIDDAERGFVLPATLLQRSDVAYERFWRIGAVAAVAP